MNNEDYKKLREQGKKYCPKCDTVKSLDDFANHRALGKQTWCKACRKTMLHARWKAGKRGPKRTEELKRQREAEDSC